MFGLFRKKKRKDLYKVEFVQCGRLDREKAEFKLGDMQTEYVEADNLIDAQKTFVSKFMITPHVYIHRISKIDRIRELQIIHSLLKGLSLSRPPVLA